MFRISRRLDYGLHLMMELAANDSGQAQPSAKLSKKLQIPLPFLHQIAHSLMQSGLIKASPGPRGGLRLNGDAKTISVQRIAEVLEGPIYMTPCMDSAEICPRQQCCAPQYMWDDLQSKIIDHLANCSLQSLVDMSKRLAETNKAHQHDSNGKKPIPAD